MVRRELRPLERPSRGPSSTLFETEVEGLYYRLFIERTISNLGGYYDLNLWDRTILQASVGASSIRHVIIALAALDLTSMATNYQSSSCMALDRRKPEGDAHGRHQFALQQYSKAIKEMREDISKTKQDLRTTLLATILIVAFEAYHGNYVAALQHFWHGQQVLKSWKASNLNLPDDDFSSPAPFLVEDELLLTFNQLELQVISHTDNMSVDAHKRLKDSGSSILPKMPAVFQTIDEAVVYATLVLRRCAHFMAMSWVYDDDENALPPRTSFSLTERVSTCSNTEAFREQGMYVKELQRFHDAFLPFFQQSRTPAGQKYFVAASCLRIHYLAIYIGVVSQFATCELFYDTLTPLFAEILELSKVVSDTTEKTNFTTAFMVIMPLDLVAKKCRDSTIRREAILLLLATPRRECLWDSVVTAKVCLWVVNIEEEGMIGGYVSEEKRVRNIGVRFRSDESTLYVCCKQPKKGSNEMIQREGAIVF